jgi:uncharacterized membrane protein YedE/YeeE
LSGGPISFSTFFVVISLLIIGLVAGFVMHRSDFCMAGAFRDLFLFRNVFMLRPLFLLIVVAAVLFETERQFGLAVTPFPFLGAPTLFSLLGGALFGLGMVIAGGCVIGVLYKLGSGGRPALVALTGLVIGSGLYAELHQSLVPLVRKTVLTEAVTLPQLTGTSALWWTLALLLSGCIMLWRWFHAGAMKRASQATGYLQPWHAALILALLGAASVAVAGVPFGMTTSYLKWVAGLEQSLNPEHVASMAIFTNESVQMSLPFSATFLRGGAGPALDAVALMQYPLIAGIILGAAFSAWRLREWSWRGQVPLRQLLAAFAGGLLMAFGSRLTPGCNVWHLWGGLPIFALQSILFIVGLLPGAWLGSRFITLIVLGKES